RGSSVGLTTGQVSLGTVSAVANTTQEVVFQFTTTASTWDADAAGLTIGASTGAFSPGSTVVVDGVTVREARTRPPRWRRSRAQRPWAPCSTRPRPSCGR